MTASEELMLTIHGTGCPVVAGLAVGVQRGKEIVDSHDADGTDKTWTVPLRLTPQGPRGPFVHGKADERFVYLVWHSGDTVVRRAKLMLDSAPDRVPGEPPAGGLLVSLSLTMADGSPVCAAVRPPRLTWGAPTAVG